MNPREGHRALKRATSSEGNCAPHPVMVVGSHSAFDPLSKVDHVPAASQRGLWSPLSIHFLHRGCASSQRQSTWQPLLAPLSLPEIQLLSAGLLVAIQKHDAEKINIYKVCKKKESHTKLHFKSVYNSLDI